MIREQLYHKTVDILKQAYFDDTLKHGNCFACAVGNIIAANMGKKIIRVKSGFGGDISVWDDAVSDNGVHNRNSVTATAYVISSYVNVPAPDDIIKQILATGYSRHELSAIEAAFEKVLCVDRYNSDKHMFDGLMAVVECLDEIHQNTDDVVTQTTKKKFEKQLA